jgi:hypothetical protein
LSWPKAGKNPICANTLLISGKAAVAGQVATLEIQGPSGAFMGVTSKLEAYFNLDSANSERYLQLKVCARCVIPYLAV